MLSLSSFSLPSFSLSLPTLPLSIIQVFCLTTFQNWGSDFELSTKESADVLAFSAMLEEKLLPALVSWCESLCVYLIICVYWCVPLWACAFDCVRLHPLIIMNISDAAHLLVSLHTVHTCITTHTHTRAHTKASMHTLDMMVMHGGNMSATWVDG